jgi:hypothetical protein
MGHATIGRGGGSDRDNLIDLRSKQSCIAEGGNFGEFVRGSHRRPEERPLEPEEPTKVEVDHRSAGGAARHEPPAGTECPERSTPRRGADTVDNDIDAATEMLLDGAWHVVLRGVIDSEFRAELPGTLQLCR